MSDPSAPACRTQSRLKTPARGSGIVVGTAVVLGGAVVVVVAGNVVDVEASIATGTTVVDGAGVDVTGGVGVVSVRAGTVASIGGLASGADGVALSIAADSTHAVRARLITTDPASIHRLTLGRVTAAPMGGGVGLFPITR